MHGSLATKNRNHSTHLEEISTLSFEESGSQIVFSLPLLGVLD